MTGFARQEGSDGVLTWNWEVKSVNGRSLDVRCRLPAGWEAFDPIIRSAVQARFARGNLQVTLTVKRASSSAEVQVNRELLEQLLQVCRELENEAAVAPPQLDGLLAVPGVVTIGEGGETVEVRANREAAIRRDQDAALDALAAARLAEGARLKQIALERLSELERQLGVAKKTAAAQPESLRARLKRQLEELLEDAPGIAEDRLAQEVAILVSKADVREELDRLAAHLVSARELLEGGGPIGRRLDFLCQELNREANTLCSKAGAADLTAIGLEMKVVIDQMREQVQNVE
jgi:uncharacterized protein (TIGR00255 family)